MGSGAAHQLFGQLTQPPSGFRIVGLRVRSRLVLNMAYNIGGATLPMLVSLITVPLYIATIGTDRYGIVAIAWLLLGYFGFLDFGLSRATANALSRLTDQSGERARVLVTSFCLNMALGALAALNHPLIPLEQVAR